MFDIAALEAAGFEKTLSLEEWEAQAADVVPLVDYRLVRGDVLLSTERNTQEQDANGLSTTVRYPEIVVLQHLVRLNLRVSCDASDTDLILTLADEFDRASDLRADLRARNREGNING